MRFNPISKDRKLSQTYYWLKDFMYRRYKRATVWAGIAFRLLSEPSAIRTHVNRSNIKKLLRYLVNGDMKSIGDKFEQYFQRFNEQTHTEFRVYVESCPAEKLVFPKTKTPLVSIILLAYSQWAYTYACLRSILENTQGMDYEVILALAGFPDQVLNIYEYVANIVVIRQEQNLGFLNIRNAAASAGKGKYVVFLNDDTNVQAGWLDALLKPAESDPKIGLVGSKLIRADGTLQEAGGIIWADASGWNYGCFDDPEKPEYNYVKEVDYISGASMMIRAGLWRKIGGFDERYAPGSFEDADLAFEVRKQGFKVVYQPRSVVICFPEEPHGRDTRGDIKSYYVANREKFSEKWKDVLQNEHLEAGKDVFWVRDRSQGRKTILVIDHYVPQFDKNAGAKTTFQYLKFFVEMGFNVKFLGDNFYRHEPYTGMLQELGIEVLYGDWYRSHWRKWVKEHSQKINYVYLNRPHIAEKYIDFFKQETKARIMYYGHDLHYLREWREFEINPSPKLRKSSRLWKLKELAIINKSDIAYYPSPVEVEEIKKELPQARIKAIPAYVFFDDQLNVIQDFAQRKDILFVGGFAHRPNLDGILWFLEEIFPKVLAKLPELKLYIIGSNPPEILNRYASRNVIVTGYISEEELKRFYSTVRMVVVPLRYGAGIKGKIVEAMYHQVPIVTTSVGAEGLENSERCLVIADDERHFSQRILDLYDDAETMINLSRQGREYVMRNFSQKSCQEAILEDFI